MANPNIKEVIHRLEKLPISEWKYTGKSYTSQIEDLKFVLGETGESVSKDNRTYYLEIYNSKDRRICLFHNLEEINFFYKGIQLAKKALSEREEEKEREASLNKLKKILRE